MLVRAITEHGMYEFLGCFYFHGFRLGGAEATSGILVPVR